MKLDRRARLQLTLQRIIFLLLFAGIIGMLAWITNHYTWQYDLTANKRHSLSDSSVELLQLLDQPVSVHAYTSDDVTTQAVREIISRYQRVKKDFSLRIFNPDIDIEQAQKDGIVMNRPFAFVIFYRGRPEHIDSLSEQSITNALLRLSRRANQQVVFIKGHGERNIDADDNRSYSTLAKQLRDTGFTLQSLNLLEQPLPAQTKLMVIAAPEKDYLEGEIEKIRRYLDAGGNLLWLRDPGPAQKLDKLATYFGVRFQPGVIVDNNPDLRKTLNIQHPAIIPVTEYFPHIITRNIRYNSLFPLARGISPVEEGASVNNWQTEALFNSFGKSWTETGGISEEMVFSSSDGDIAGPITIAVALHRPSPNGGGSQLQRAVIAGDSDFLANGYIGAGANLDLGLNIFNWLIGDDDLVTIETRSSPDIRLQLDDTEIKIIAFGFFLIIPLLLLITGFRIWYVRKRR